MFFISMLNFAILTVHIVLDTDVISTNFNASITMVDVIAVAVGLITALNGERGRLGREKAFSVQCFYRITAMRVMMGFNTMKGVILSMLS